MFDSNLFREAVKKKYDIQQQEANIKQQEANTGQADQLARAPLYGAQAQHYAGANDEEQRKTLAMAPMWEAEAGRVGAMTEGQNQENAFNKEINPYRIKNNIATANLNSMFNESALQAEQERQKSEWAGKNLVKAPMYTPPSKPEKGWLETIFGRGPTGTGIGDALYEYNNPEIADPNYDKYIASMKALAASNKSKLAEYDNRFAPPVLATPTTPVALPEYEDGITVKKRNGLLDIRNWEG